MHSLRRFGIHFMLSFLSVFVVSLVWFSASMAQDGTDEEKLEQGARLYADNCAVCHGPNGEGRVGANISKDWPSIRPDLVVESIIINGVPGSVMPAWSQENGGPLTQDQIDALVYYILSWQTGGLPQVDLGPTATPRPAISPVPKVEGDPNSGAVLYDENCALCHGLEGQGRIGATLAKDWPAIRADLSLRSIISSGVGGTLMPAWSQDEGGPLSAEQINDLVAYILSWEGSSQVVSSPPDVQTPSPPPLGSSWILWGIVLVVLAGAGVLLFLQRQ